MSILPFRFDTPGYPRTRYGRKFSVLAVHEFLPMMVKREISQAQGKNDNKYKTLS